MTWVLNVSNVLFFIWIVAAISDRPSEDCPPGRSPVRGRLRRRNRYRRRPDLSSCGRVYPHCGEDVKKGRASCKNCGYDFTIGGERPVEAPST